MAYGSKHRISKNIWDYSIGLLGEAGIGKTTTMYKVCDKIFGDNGYLLLNCGMESGLDALDGVMAEDVETWQKFVAVVNDICANKEKDYSELKVVIVDTLDQLIAICEPYMIAKYNHENMGTKDFNPAKSVNGIYGGFGAGQDMIANSILGMFWKLKKVGVTVWYTGHVKIREITDPLTNTTYTSLSTNMQQRYFSAFKTKTDLVGVAAIDRKIEKQATGRKNIVTRKDITINKVIDERRKVVFRDDSYSVDSKCRFEHIVNQIPLDADAFIKALQDAIEASKNPSLAEEIEKTNLSIEDTEGSKIIMESGDNSEGDTDLSKDVNAIENDFGMNEPEESDADYPDDLREAVKMKMKDCVDSTKKNEARAYVKDNFGTYSKVTNDGLMHLWDLMK